MVGFRISSEGETTGFVDGLGVEYRRKTVKITPRFLARATGRTGMPLTKMEKTMGGADWGGRNQELGFGEATFEMPIRHLCGNVE